MHAFRSYIFAARIACDSGLLQLLVRFLTTSEASWFIVLVDSVLLSVCTGMSVYVWLSDNNFRKPRRRKFIFANPVYFQAIRVKFGSRIEGKRKIRKRKKGKRKKGKRKIGKLQTCLLNVKCTAPRQRVAISVRNREVGYFCCQSSSYQIAYAVNNEGVSTGPTQGPYILQLCMGPSYFWGVSVWPILTHPLFRTLVAVVITFRVVRCTSVLASGKEVFVACITCCLYVYMFILYV